VRGCGVGVFTAYVVVLSLLFFVEASTSKAYKHPYCVQSSVDELCFLLSHVGNIIQASSLSSVLDCMHFEHFGNIACERFFSCVNVNWDAGTHL